MASAPTSMKEEVGHADSRCAVDKQLLRPPLLFRPAKSLTFLASFSLATFSLLLYGEIRITTRRLSAYYDLCHAAAAACPGNPRELSLYLAHLHSLFSHLKKTSWCLQLGTSSSSSPFRAIWCHYTAEERGPSFWRRVDILMAPKVPKIKPPLIIITIQNKKDITGALYIINRHRKV